MVRASQDRDSSPRPAGEQLSLHLSFPEDGRVALGSPLDLVPWLVPHLAHVFRRYCRRSLTGFQVILNHSKHEGCRRAANGGEFPSSLPGLRVSSASEEINFRKGGKGEKMDVLTIP